MPERLLVIKPSSLGDVIHALAIIQTLRWTRPEIVVDWVIRSDLAPLIAYSGLADHVYKFHRDAGLGAFFRLIREIRRTEYESVWDMQGLARTALMTYGARAKRKIGRSDARECAFLAYREHIGPTQILAKEIHAMDILAHFLPTLGLSSSVTGLIDWRQSHLAAAEAEIPSLALFPEARGRGKEWPLFPLLAQGLLQDERLPAGWSIKILGCRKDNAFASHPRLEDERGRTHLAELLSLIRHARCVVANDSGPVHLAASMGTPVIGLYGPTDPKRFGPYPSSRPSNAWIRAAGGDLKTLPVPKVIDRVFEILEL
ncbi:MAG: glycosyltransferase family 9 protein [Puniceicoccales bacterium]|jgi:ADP-heptose:LPS heptosyltransferase|nr:glycosyltransferase family 9 protein [Puniceicoccales bacterium]